MKTYLFAVMVVVSYGQLICQEHRFHRDNLLVAPQATLVSLDSGYFRFHYSFVSDSSSVQSMVSVAVELNDEWREDGGSLRNAVAPTEKDWGESPHVGEKVRWFAQYDTTGIDILELAPHAAILRGERLSFSFEAEGLPGIVRFWSEGWAPWFFNEDEIDSLLQEGYPESDLHAADENFLTGYTIGRRSTPNPFEGITFIDTITSYINQGRSLGWILDQPTASKYSTLFDSARGKLQANQIIRTRAKLDTVLMNVHSDSSAHLTSEAYALLRFNTEYLLKMLPHKYTMSVNITGNGTVTTNPNQEEYDSASTVQLTATPSTSNYFINWTGDVNDTAHSMTVTMNSNKSITAHFLDDLGLASTNASSSLDATATNNARHLTKSASYLHEVLTSGGNVFYRRSSNGGSTWNLTSQITQNGSNSRPCITTKDHDYIQMVWQRSIGSSTYEVWHSYSSTDGSSWSTPAILPSATQVTVSSFQTQGVTPVVTETVGAQTIVVVYCSSSGLRYRTSTNRGTSWQVPQNDIISGQYNDRVEYPSLAGGSSSITLLYDYAGQDGGPYSRVFNGTSWSSETSVSKGTGATVGAFSSVAIDGNNSPIAAWSGMTNSWTRSIIFRSGSSNNTWSKWFASFGQGPSGPDWVNPALTYCLAGGTKYGVDIVNHTSSNQVKLIQYVDPSWTTSTLSQSGAWGSITEGTSSSGTPTYCWTDQGPFPYEIVSGSSGLSPLKNGTTGTLNTVGVIQKRRAVVYHPVLGSTLTFDFGPIRVVNTNGDTSDIGFRTPSLRDRDSINIANMWDYLGSDAVNLPANARRLIVGKQFGIRGPSIWKQRFLFRVLNTNGLQIGVLDTMANDGTVSLNITQFAGMRVILRPQVPLGGIDPAAITVGVGDIFLLSIPPGESRDKSR